MAKCHHLSDLFNVDLTFLRVRCRDYVIKLWSLAPAKFGLQSIDIYWRKCQYEPYTLCKRLKQGWTPVERARVQSHLMNGLSQFHDFLARIREVDQGAKLGCMDDWHLDFMTQDTYGNSRLEPGRLEIKEFCQSNLVNDVFFSVKFKHSDSNALRVWILHATHQCLIYLGDLSRYLLEFIPRPDLEVPHRYYLQAFQVDPSNGTPFNQLATLSGDKCHGLDATFFYLRG